MMLNTDKKYVAIVDYGMGNLFSIMNICRYVGIEAIRTSDKDQIEGSSAVILPGVGAFGDAMDTLEKMGLVQVLKDAVSSGKYFLGICLGMQLLMSESEEFGSNRGLNIITGEVKKFPVLTNRNDKIRVPHVGWNRIFLAQNPTTGDPILRNIRDEEPMYFAHSFYVVPREEDAAITYTDYCGIRYCSGIRKDNVVAFQFHPEKSGLSGIQIFKNIKEIICEDKEDDRE